MSDSNFPQSSSDETSWNDALVDSLLRETAKGGSVDKAFLASVEEAIDAENDSTARITPMPPQNTRRPWLWSSGIAAVLVVGLAALYFFSSNAYKRPQADLVVHSDSREGNTQLEIETVQFQTPLGESVSSDELNDYVEARNRSGLAEVTPSFNGPDKAHILPGPEEDSIATSVSHFSFDGMLSQIGLNSTAEEKPAIEDTNDDAKNSGVAENYIAYLQELVRRADEFALLGTQLLADGDHQGAIDQFRAALDILPETAETKARKAAYTKLFSRASVALATARADEGRYPESIAMIEEVLQPSRDPDNIDAKRLLERLNDPDYYSPVLSPTQLERVRRVKLAIKTGQGYRDLGDVDRADSEFHKALNEDPYNIAARQTGETAERFRMNYYDAAYDHNRAKMLSEIASGWESPIPTGVDDLTTTLSSLDVDDSNFLNPTSSSDGVELQRNHRFAVVGHGGQSFAYGDEGNLDAVKLQIAAPVPPEQTNTPARTGLSVGLSENLVPPHFGVSAVQREIAPTRPAYGTLVDNPWFSPLDEPLSTFSIDVDTASWTNLRAMIRDGRSADAIPNDAVRIEELINYFNWDYPQPDGDHPFAFASETAECPWNENHRLMRVGIQGRDIPRTARPDANLVFLLDVSGSMNQPNKLPLVKRAISVLVEELEERDTVSIVVYAGAEGLALKPTSGRDQITIQNALENLSAGGSTNGGAGIKLAYQLAREQFKDGGINRVILCTDGDFNVGTTGTDALVSLVEEKAESGVFLSVCGFGQDNLNDAMLEEITNRGNGNYSYIDGFREARKVFLQDLMGTLVTIAKDVKIQVEFNPAEVAGYRLIGYANRKLEAEDFENDEIDAGEVGSGHAVTALYEIVPAGAKDNPADDETALRYQKKHRATPKRDLIPSGELALLKLRYKQPESEQSILMEQPVMPSGKKWERASDDFRFASAVGLFGMILREHESIGDATFQEVIEIASKAKGADPQGWRAEFVDLVRQLADR